MYPKPKRKKCIRQEKSSPNWTTFEKESLIWLFFNFMTPISD